MCGNCGQPAPPNSKADICWLCGVALPGKERGEEMSAKLNLDKDILKEEKGAGRSLMLRRFWEDVERFGDEFDGFE